MWHLSESQISQAGACSKATKQWRKPRFNVCSQQHSVWSAKTTMAERSPDPCEMNTSCLHEGRGTCLLAGCVTTRIAACISGSGVAVSEKRHASSDLAWTPGIRAYIEGMTIEVCQDNSSIFLLTRATAIPRLHQDRILSRGRFLCSPMKRCGVALTDWPGIAA
jgi:hypothetical protein